MGGDEGKGASWNAGRADLWGVHGGTLHGAHGHTDTAETHLPGGGARGPRAWGLERGPGTFGPVLWGKACSRWPNLARSQTIQGSRFHSVTESPTVPVVAAPLSPGWLQAQHLLLIWGCVGGSRAAGEV